MNGPRGPLLVVAVAGLLVAIVVALRAPAPEPVGSLPSATPTASLSAPPSPSPSAPPSATATAAPQRDFVSRLGYALTVAPPWRRASCPAPEPTRTALPLIDHFTSATALDEELGHVGSGPNDRIEVMVQANPQRLSPAEYSRAFPLPGPVPAQSGWTPETITFAGRPAAQVSFSDFPSAYFLLVADGDRMFTISARVGTSRQPDLQPLLAVVRTFRFASPTEIAAVPSPTPIPAGGATPQALAAALTSAFQQRDAAVLERHLSPCVSQGVEQGGGSAISRERFIASLRTQLASGLTVTVDPATVVTDGRFGPGVATVRSRWNAQPPMGTGAVPSPGAGTQNVALMLAPTAGGYYWLGTILLRPD